MTDVGSILRDGLTNAPLAVLLTDRDYSVIVAALADAAMHSSGDFALECRTTSERLRAQVRGEE